jgi:hypothetical protein
MALAKESVSYFIPKGLSDSLDQSNSFDGSCQMMQNLIFDRTDSNALTSRPGAVAITTFPGVTSPGTISMMKPVGNLIYGMIGSALNAGKDQPFVYNVTSNSFQTITGITNSNTPTTQTTSGEWTPPSMDVVGGRVLVTHPGFNYGAGYYFGWFDISGFLSNNITFTATSTSNVLTSPSSNPVTAGYAVGMTITGTNIPANSTITNLSATTVTISNAATGNGTLLAMTVAGGTSSQPLWGAGNLSGAVQFTTVPTSVAQFYNRAYYGTGNNVVFSDSLNPTYATSATQVLTLGDATLVLSMKGLPYTTTTSGVLQALMVFKSGAIWAITGDAASSSQPLSLNSVSEETTNIMPQTIDIAPEGIVFIDSSGPRLIGHDGVVRWLTDQQSRTPDLINPFTACSRITRANGAYCNSVYRVCLDTTVNNNSVTYDYWYDFTKARWTGPHSFIYHQVVPYSNHFLLARNDVSGTIYQSNVVQNSGSVYTELGLPYQFNITTAFMPIKGTMNMQQIVESTMEIGVYGTNTTYNITMYNEYNNSTVGTPIIATSNLPQWGVAVWGAFTWAWSIFYCVPKLMNWSNPFVFNKAILQISGTAVNGTKIKNIFMRYQDAGYTAVS